MTYEQMKAAEFSHVCAECSSRVNVAWGGFTESRRDIMAEQIGTEKAQALQKYQTTGLTITKDIATEIVESLWGDAPTIEKTKCILLCQTYQLNPLMRHIHLVGYKQKDGEGKLVKVAGKQVYDWSIQMGIAATRLLARRKHRYSYMDMTPRKATSEEIEKILGDTADTTKNIYGFTHIKDMDTGAEAYGLRGIEKKASVKGAEKGNTHLNMACIRSERQAVDRLYPGDMPDQVDVFDERFVEVDGVGKVDNETGEIIEPGIIEGEAIELEPEPDDIPELPKENNLENPERLITESEDADLKALMSDTGIGAGDVGIRKFTQLTLPQYNQVCAFIREQAEKVKSK
jgi:hypothetical protein